MLLILEENPSAPNEKDNAIVREFLKRMRNPNKVEPLESLPFPPKIDERAFLDQTKPNQRKTKAANGWFFYRKAYVEELKAIGRTYPMTEISKHIAELWKKEPEQVRNYYKELAIKAANLHHQKYGDNVKPTESKVKKLNESRGKKPKKPNHEPLTNSIKPTEPTILTEPVPPSPTEIKGVTNPPYLLPPHPLYYYNILDEPLPYSFILDDAGYYNEERSFFYNEGQSIFCNEQQSFFLSTCEHNEHRISYF
ncbi:25586_t:CDS:1 [Racocetra persica]|uniref:25586_t:CDS:1 n=1 Tax=Racocetra persica TaxID=160502 RepID=A0ACA9K8Y3_9GLOM|nr:25586_t:CDS:1 [Racocetra persica]